MQRTSRSRIQPTPPLLNLAAAGAALAAYRLYVRRIERRPAHELALRRSPGLVAGMLYGALLVSATVGLVAAMHGYRIEAVTWPASLPADCAYWLFVAVGQEVVFRGLLLGRLEARLGSWAAMAISGAAFGAFHLINPNATVWAGAALALESVGCYAAVWMLSRSLWVVIGVHFAWNAMEASVFGLADSGVSYPGALAGRISGPFWLTGGGFGIEASAPAVLVCAAAGAIVLYVAHRRGGIRPWPLGTSASRAPR